MATLKEHQNAMVDLLANGSAIPASAARLAHALHDVLGLLLERDSVPRRSRVSEHMGTFIQDVRLASDLGSTVSPHQRDSLLIDHLRAELACVTDERDMLAAACESLRAKIAGRCDTYEEVKKENDELKARCESSDAGLAARLAEIDRLKERIEDAEEKLGW